MELKEKSDLVKKLVTLFAVLGLCFTLLAPVCRAEDLPPLIAAAKDGDCSQIQTLLHNGANIHARYTKFGVTALMIAAAQQPKEVVELLLKNGADPNARSTAGETALSLARESPHKGVVAVLQQYGAK